MSVIVRNLTKYYGKTRAVDNISFEVDAGEIIGFLGPNGAGKTTTVRMITGYLSPTSGTIEVHGQDVRRNPYKVRRMIGYLPEENPIYPDMDVIDYLEFIAKLQNLPKNDIPSRISEMIKLFDLGDVKHMDIAQLSKGYRQRVGLAQALVHDPPVLILDEPTNGLDPNQIKEFRKILSEMGQRKTVILSTHALAEVQALCNRVIIIGRGRILADASIVELQEKFQGREGFLVEFEKSSHYTSENLQRTLESLHSIAALAPLSAANDGDNVIKFYVESQKNVDIRKQIIQLCIDKRLGLIDIHRQRVRIEEIFHQLTTG